MDMPDTTERLAQLLRQAGSAHHRAFATTNGEDACWPTWYADYLAQPLGELLGRPLPVDVLAADLVVVDRVFRDAGARLAWPEYYAEWILRRYRGTMAKVGAL